MNLLAKYNTAAPRYTSYPTVPYWDKDLSLSQWMDSIRSTFTQSNHKEGISLYIHLPYCESLCTYCACNTRITVNHSVELPYILALLEEWSLYLDLLEETPRIKELHLGGGTPTFFSATHLKILVEGILSTSLTCPAAEFSFEGHPNNTSAEHLQTLFDLGFKRVSFGIQDFDKNVQNIINRVQSFEQVEDVVNAARSIGYNSVNFDLVYGLPLQTRASVMSTINKVNRLRPERIAFYSYAHVPWLRPGQGKFTEKDLPPDVEKRALYEIGKSKFLENGYMEIGMDHFALPGDPLTNAFHTGTLHRNFMGYTPHFTRLLIGLGASSISDSWYAFGQNYKKVEDYIGAVSKGILPLSKGHELSVEDLVIRKHILNLMCQQETNWNEGEMKFARLDEILERLMPLKEDGLVEFGSNHLSITAKGKRFLRNICLCFDTRYWDKRPASPIFSNST